MRSLYLSASSLAALIALTVACPSPAQAGGGKVTVYGRFTDQQFERLLNRMGASFRKMKSTSPKTKYLYSVTTANNNQAIFMIMKQGRMIWAIATFEQVSLETLNTWNRRAATTRAILNRNNKTGKYSSVVEWQIDSGGGTTEEFIRGFVDRFRRDVDDFAVHIKNKKP